MTDYFTVVIRRVREEARQKLVLDWYISSNRKKLRLTQDILAYDRKAINTG